MAAPRQGTSWECAGRALCPRSKLPELRLEIMGPASRGALCKKVSMPR